MYLEYNKKQFYKLRYKWKELNKEYTELKEIADKEGKTCGQTAINWVLRQEGISTALVGVKNPDQVEENLKAVGWEPSAENCESMEKIFA